MRDLKTIALLLISLLILLVFFVTMATAIGPQETVAPIPTGVIKAAMGNNSAREVYQMGTVYWKETIDMRLVVYGDGLLVHPSTGRIVDVSSFTRRIYIDPNVFLPGEWDKWTPYREDAGNNMAFIVKTTKPPVNETVNASEQNTTAISITLGEPQSWLERRHVADILIAKGDSFTYEIMPNNTPAKAWIFGSTDKIYDIPVKSRKITLTPEQTQSLTAGSYHLVLHTVGKNRILEADYVSKDPEESSITEHIESQFRRTPFLELGTIGSGPQVVYREFVPWLKQYSDDGIEEYDLEVQVPMVDISAIDESFSEGKSVWQVRGYTNLMKGTEVRAILDEEKQTDRTLRANTATTTAFGDIIGDLREFSVNVPINYDELTVGEHFITVRSSFGAFMRVSRWIYNMPEGQERPADTTKYSGGNLFVPTPTPEIITVTIPVPGPEIVKTVIITPRPTPTPVPTPWYFESPWLYLEIIAAVVGTVLVVLWIMWKKGVF